MSKFLGDFTAGDVIDFKFTTYRPSTGAPFTLAGSPVVSVYKNNDVTQDTAGAVLTVDFDGVTGLHHVRITANPAGGFYTDGGEFECVITTGTVDSVSVVGACIGRFTLGATAANVYNALLANYTLANSFGARLIRTLSTSVSNECQINALNHISANVHQMQAGVVTAAAVAADADEAIADALLNRNLAGGSNTGRLVKEALYALRNKSEISGTQLNVYNATDGAIAWSATVSSSAAADPVTGIDPP